MCRPRLRADERGFTLIELLVTMVLLMVGLAATLALVEGANQRTVVTKEREGATALMRELLEDTRSVPDSQLTTAALPGALQAFSGLQDTTPGGVWTVRRRNQTYALTTSVCSVDDPQDGYGDHGGIDFCAGATGTADSNPNDYKRVTVTAQWARSGQTRSATQVAIVGHETSSGGPGLEFVARTPSDAEITTNPVGSSIVFTVQTTEVAAKIRFAVEGVEKGVVTPSTTTATFAWKIDGGADGHVYDGTYVISATAYDSTGRPGPTRSLTVKLNRDLPLAVSPSPPRGGYNARLGITELEWNRNPEPDIMGYRVYRERSSNSNVKLICEYLNQPSASTCIDTNPPNAQVDYTVIALDTAPGTSTAREGAVQTSLLVKKTNNQPVAPASLTATTSSGNIVLTWPASPAPTYDSPNFIRFYRIYRGGTALSNRIAVSTTTSYTDQNAAGKGFKYYITAVDKSYSESPIVGPVQ